MFIIDTFAEFVTYVYAKLALGINPDTVVGWSLYMDVHDSIYSGALVAIWVIVAIVAFMLVKGVYNIVTEKRVEA